ncbi:SMC-Scp complex subunit ScpB [Candidatus Saccharibacteria bacterium]|nr:SMC-Scp complex subunit ScpB [Candidatus Saccharibacteria bacterium]NIV03394.1 SMC-Scp complex subunit ScpB [Calditrichia bacterium]NIS37938.1 SMC-Scp complex subunit ScpB [Candidatus Saccharibacteria bacterium]NIV71600.1 SMC-Scp complex subunit ScpB [Calditrichia bacterium]NIV98218.1 SMC-Scp complex subunit ScpB [Candidatus Saccharibacteria bacterium]
MSLSSKIESILFVTNKPITVKKVSQVLGVDEKKIEAEMPKIMEGYNVPESGVYILKKGKEYQMMSSPDNAKIVQAYLQDETTGELTRPSLETLAIIAYRGPLTKPEIEQIRGVNCSLILRNLMTRGLVETQEDEEKKMQVYSITFDFMRFLGISSMSKLPDYDKLRHHEFVEKALEALEDQKPEGGEEKRG